MSNMSRYVHFVSIIMLSMILAGAFIVLYQSSITIDVIDRSLARHVEQYLLERPTQEIVMREISTLYRWLSATTAALIVTSLALLFMGWQKARGHAKNS